MESMSTARRNQILALLATEGLKGESFPLDHLLNSESIVKRSFSFGLSAEMYSKPDLWL